MASIHPSIRLNLELRDVKTFEEAVFLVVEKEQYTFKEPKKKKTIIAFRITAVRGAVIIADIRITGV